MYEKTNLAQFERSLIHQIVKTGLKSAKLRRKTGSRPRAINEKKLEAIKESLASGMSKVAIYRTFNVKRSTLINSLARDY